jgi:plastocyanin
MPDSPSAASTTLIIATSVVVASVFLLIGGVVMALAMGDHIGFMRGSSDTANQTPFVTDEGSVTITISDFTFSPANLTVDAGTEVTWTNEDSAVHDATDREDAWRTELLSKGDSQTVMFDSPGAFDYFCTIHPWMEGTITVR